MSNSIKFTVNELIRLYLINLGVSPTELSFLDGATSNIQTQIDTNNPIGPHQAWIGKRDS